MFEGPKCLSSHRYYTLGTAMKKKVQGLFEEEGFDTWEKN